MQENQKYLDQALKVKRNEDIRNNMGKTYDRLNLLNQIKEITNKEQVNQSLKHEKIQDTQAYIKNAIDYKSKEKELEKRVKLKEEQKMIVDQQNHFDSMAKRYKDIFVAIDEKDKKIQDSYRNLKPAILNLAIAESERYKSIDDIIK